MRRRGRLAALLVAAATAAATLVGAPPASQAAPGSGSTYTNPVFGGDYPDPFVLPARGAYYAYGTNRGVNVQVLTSPDLRRWTLHSEALPVLPNWATGGHTWAPSVVEAGGRYVLYFTARHGSARVPCIGVAVSAHPGGPFASTDSHPLMCQPERGGSIDPSPYRDDDGSLWLLWKSEGHLFGEPTRIWSQRLSSDGTWLMGDPSHLVRRDRAWEGHIVENPAMIRLGTKLFLFYSGGRWQDTSYGIGYAECASVRGPCTKAAAPLVRSSATVAGPGGQDFLRIVDGTVWMTYHGWTPGRVGYPDGHRSLRLDKIALVNGRPFVSGPTAHPVSVSGSPDRPAVTIAAQPSATGYRVVADDGDVFTFGTATDEGSAGARTVDATRTRSGSGYWTVSPDGSVHAFGDAVAVTVNGPARFATAASGIASAPTGLGYWVVSDAGEVHAVGDAGHHGSLSGVRLASPVVDIAPTTSGRGYWLAAADGGVFAFGDARFAGSAAGVTRARITSIAADPAGGGYWLAAADGGVFSFGGAPFHGSAAPHRPRPVVDIEANPRGGGYWLLGADGGVFSFGTAPFHGSSPMPG